MQEYQGRHRLEHYRGSKSMKLGLWMCGQRERQMRHGWADNMADNICMADNQNLNI